MQQKTIEFSSQFRSHTHMRSRLVAVNDRCEIYACIRWWAHQFRWKWVEQHRNRIVDSCFVFISEILSPKMALLSSMYQTGVMFDLIKHEYKWIFAKVPCLIEVMKIVKKKCLKRNDVFTTSPSTHREWASFAQIYSLASENQLH